jgi:MFS family permease
VLKRVYGAETVSKHDYSTTLSSLAFAGTIVGMLTFGYISDKVGRKAGMVSPCLVWVGEVSGTELTTFLPSNRWLVSQIIFEAYS